MVSLMSKASGTMAALPDELLRFILEAGIKSSNPLTYRDLCSISISCRRLHRLSGEDPLWSLLLSSDFPNPPSASADPPSPSYKFLYRLGFEKDRSKKRAAHNRAVLRKESQIAEHLRKLRELESSLASESDRLKGASTELSDLLRSRQAAAALNVWQPEAVRGRQKQVVEQSPVHAESRISSLNMELKLCKQQVATLRKSYEDERRRLEASKQELESIKYHPLRHYESTNNGVLQSGLKRKKLKKSVEGKTS